MSDRLRLVVLGLSLSSSWGNGHATTYRALLKAFAERGHDVLFLERDTPWYAAHRDLTEPDWCRLVLYPDLESLGEYREAVSSADAVIVGSYVPDGIAVGRFVQEHARGVTAFYDIDTPVTLAALARGDCTYLSTNLIPGYDLYLSFTGGPTLRRIEELYGSPSASPLFCSVDPSQYKPQDVPRRWDLSYLGTYSADRQPKLERLLLAPARRLPHMRFVVAGPQYPAEIEWPANVERIHHLGPEDHAAFYSASRFTLNVTRDDMVAAGWSPSVRLFEAAACRVAIISDAWKGIETIFAPDRDIFLAEDADSVFRILTGIADETREATATNGRRRVIEAHTASSRAKQLEHQLRQSFAKMHPGSNHDFASLF